MRHVGGGLGLLAAAVGVTGWVLSRSRAVRDRSSRDRWIVVTVNCPPQRLASPADLPEPLIRIGDIVDLEICPAPGDRGTEIGARLRDHPRPRIAGSGRRDVEDLRAMVEDALREARSIIETGEVLLLDRPFMREAARPVGRRRELVGQRGGRR